MAVRRKKQNLAEWSWRMAGLVLCAFFGLGVLAGLGMTRRQTAFTLRSRLLDYGSHLFKGISPLNRASLGEPPIPPEHDRFAVALLERSDGFYALSSSGELRGPVSAEGEGDLPILSGASLQSARSPQLLEYARTLVRAEAVLGELVSEMSVDDDGTVSLFLERSRTELNFDLTNAGPELQRASFLLRRWRAHRDLIAALDMTAPGEAVMRLRTALPIVGDSTEERTAAVYQTFEPSADQTRSRTGELTAR